LTEPELHTNRWNKQIHVTGHTKAAVEIALTSS
jgi:hypothetical protein